MKILILSTAYYPFVAEAEVAIKEITDRIVDAEFYVLTVNLNGKEKPFEKIGMVSVYRIGSGRIGKYLFPITGFVKALALHRKHSFGFVWSVMASYAGFAGLFFKLTKPKVPFLLTLHEGNSVEYIKRRARLVYPLFKFLFKKADFVATVSNYLADFSVMMGFKKNPLVHSCGMSISSFVSDINYEEVNHFRKTLGLDHDDIVLITTSRLLFRNGIADVIKALARMSIKTKLVVCGDGPELDTLKSLTVKLGLSDRVFFRGFVNHEQIPLYLKSCDVFVRPSLSEISGNSFAEAFAAKIAVVATPLGGIESFLVDGVTGYLCQPEDPNSIVRAIDKWASDQNKKAVVDKAFKLSVVQYHWKNLAIAFKRCFGLPIKVAVVGAGVFGSSAAIRLARSGCQVSLFEKDDDILKAASGINQYRLHRGYHYPRSISTALSSKESESSFKLEYGSAVMDGKDHYYCVAKEHSKVSAEKFIDFCDKCQLEHEEAVLDCINPDSVQLTIKGKESLINPMRLKELIKEAITESNLKLILNQSFSASNIDLFDFTVNCSYANLNSILDGQSQSMREYQFELCEKPVLELPTVFNNKSIVILDGPFMCIDPYGETNLHVMGNVVHAIHATNVGFFPIIPEKFLPLLNKGIIKNPPITNIKDFIASASLFMPEISQARHVGSMFTIRTVLPRLDATDDRPTLVDRLNEQVINVFSGKIGNSVLAAEQVLALVEAKSKS